MAHRVYLLGLDSLLTNQLQPEPVNLRVYELEREKPRAFFDVSETLEPQVLQMSTSGKHLEAFERGLSTILTTPGQTDREAELRLLREPALNFEAFWIHGNDQEDSIVPITWLGPIPQYQVTRLDKALDTLREAARHLQNMDDEIGA